MKIVRKIKPEIKEKRGDITKLLDDGKSKIKSILLITSKAGSVRSNHYHRKDAHWIYILSGKMGYYEKPVKGNRIKKATFSRERAAELIPNPSSRNETAYGQPIRSRVRRPYPLW